MKKTPKVICPANVEVQRRRTYEIIGRYIGESHNITVELVDDATPHCDPKRKHIVLPRNVKTDCLYPAIAWTMHEGAHCRYTTYDTSKITGNDPINHEILNVLEDIRIDNKNFRLLPNINSFYEEMVKYLDTPAELKRNNSPVEARVMVDLILKLEDFGYYASKDPDIEDFMRATDIERVASRGISELELLATATDSGGDPTRHIKRTRAIIRKIRELLYQFKQQQQSPQMIQVNAGGAHAASAIDIQGVGSNGSAQKIFGRLEANPQGGVLSISPAALREQTQKKFREILNIKERHVVSQGQVLDADNLASFLTGDIESLFKEDATIINKKSKIIIVLDSSGSMGSKLMDGKACNEVVAATAKSIGLLLDEAKHEGIHVDYEVRAFDDRYFKLNREDFISEYLKIGGGGTNLDMAFKEAQAELINDYTVEGKRIIIFVTDGCVSQGQIDGMIASIMQHNQDVRCMILGVGADPGGDFVTRVSGFNIIAQDLADITLLEAIMETIQ